MYPMTNLVAEARKKYLFAMVAAAALVAAILVYLHFQGRWGYLVAITALAILFCMLVALFILPSIFIAPAKLQTIKQ